MSMQSVRDWYASKIFNNMPYLLEHYDEKHGSFCIGDQGNQHCLRPFAWFYKHLADGNPVYQDARILEKIIRAGDSLVASEKAGHHGGTLHGEWPPYNLLECYDWLSGELGNDRKTRWREALTRHIERVRLTSNYIATAPNHYIWRAAVISRAAKLLNRPDWMAAAEMLARQVGKMQTPDGYWDEAHRGHGPSTNYHRVHLHGLDLYYRNSGDEEVREALLRATDFALRASYPDGSPIETFDGRQPYVAAFAVAMAANAFSRLPAGRRLLKNLCQRADELGLADARHPCGYAMSWYAFATTDFMVDCHRFVEDGPEAPLPAEQNGQLEKFTMTKQRDEAGALVLRRGSWTCAAAAIESDVPRFISNVYITERQTGFSLFHEKAGLIVGGGNRMRNHAPLANAIVLTGWHGVDCNAGVFHAPYLDELEKSSAGQEVTEHMPFISAAIPRPGHEGIDPVKCCYHPIQRHVAAAPGNTGLALTLEFLHGTIRFELTPLDARSFRIGYSFHMLSVKKLLLQVAVPLLYPGEFCVDGKSHQVDDMENIQSLPLKTALTLQARGCQVNYCVPSGRTAHFTFPLEPIKNAQLKRMNYVPDQHFKPLYTVGLFTQEFVFPPNATAAARGEGELLRIDCD